jgi:hypothetical protein
MRVIQPKYTSGEQPAQRHTQVALERGTCFLASASTASGARLFLDLYMPTIKHQTNAHVIMTRERKKKDEKRGRGGRTQQAMTSEQTYLVVGFPSAAPSSSSPTPCRTP